MEITYRYNVGDVVQFKEAFESSASSGLKYLVGKTVTIIDRRFYGGPCYKFDGLGDQGWFTEDTIKSKVNPYVVFGGDAMTYAEPLGAFPNKEDAIILAKSLQNDVFFVEVVYMPEENEDTHKVVYSHYEEVN